jgi:hypothetical protein
MDMIKIFEKILDKFIWFLSPFVLLMDSFTEATITVFDDAYDIIKNKKRK